VKNITQHTGTLEFIDRLPSSVNGNPRYLVRLDGWTCRTAPDSAVAYFIPNHFGKKVTANIGTYYGYATIKNVKKA
jgi:hypothetical protein